MRLSSARNTVMVDFSTAPASATSGLLFPAMSRTEHFEGGAVHLVGGRQGQLALGHGPHTGSPEPGLQEGPLAVEGTGPVLGQAVAVNYHPHHPIEDQEQLVAGLALLGYEGPSRKFSDPGFGRPVHQVVRELAF